MRNKILDEGCTIPYAHSSAVVSGQPVLIGDVLGVAVKDYEANEEGMYDIEGVFELPKTTADALAQGAICFWDDTAKKITSTASTNKPVAIVWVAGVNGDTTCRVSLKALTKDNT